MHFWDEMEPKPQFATPLKRLPGIFGKPVVQIWYVLLPAYFFFFVTTVYRPFGMEEALDMGAGLFYFNAAMLMSIVLICQFLMRFLFQLFYRSLSKTWIGYIFWCVGEMALVTYLSALYLYLMSSGAEPYFTQLAICLQYSFLILIYPYFGITVVCVLIQDRMPFDEASGRDIIRFADSSGNVRLAISASALLFIRAEDNYVKIHYLDNGKVKDYLLRSTMNAVAPLVEPFGLFRCQRSWYVNTNHIVALRKDPDDSITAELDAGGIAVPVSRALYRELSALL